MGKVILNKLVRDLIPCIIESERLESINVFKLNDEGFQASLLLKLEEELNEYIYADPCNEKEELADLLTVMGYLTVLLRNDGEIMKLYNEKALTKGKFDEKYFLMSYESREQ